jgi:hypothetical protein
MSSNRYLPNILSSTIMIFVPGTDCSSVRQVYAHEEQTLECLGWVYVVGIHCVLGADGLQIVLLVAFQDSRGMDVEVDPEVDPMVVWRN